MSSPTATTTDILSQWVNRVVEWQADNTLSGLCEQLTALPELTTFLQHLAGKLTELGTVEQAVSIFPRAGQLLGRLCGLPMLLHNQECHEILMRCILFFWTEIPGSSLEAKAKSWALSQTRSMVCQTDGLFIKSGVHRNSAVSAAPTSNFYQQCIKQIKSALSHIKRHQPRRNWNSQLQCMVPAFPPVNQQLVEMCRLCLYLRHLVEFAQLLDECVRQLQYTVDADSDCVQKFCEELMEAQERPHSDLMVANSLPYWTQVYLWQHHWPSLECKMLSLVESALSLDHLDEEHISKTLQSHHLPRACGEHPEIFTAVTSLLHLVEQTLGGEGQSQRHRKLTRLKELLGEHIRHCIQHSESEAFIQAASDISNLSTPPTKEEFAVLYGLFKQAIAGDCTAERPESDLLAQAQFDAWKQMKGTPQDEAAARYIDEARLVKEKYGLKT